MEGQKRNRTRGGHTDINCGREEVSRKLIKNLKRSDGNYGGEEVRIKILEAKRRLAEIKEANRRSDGNSLRP